MTCTCVCASRDEIASSNRISCGSHATALAMHTRCSCPPESSCGNRSRNVSSSPTNSRSRLHSAAGSFIFPVFLFLPGFPPSVHPGSGILDSPMSCNPEIPRLTHFEDSFFLLLMHKHSFLPADIPRCPVQTSVFHRCRKVFQLFDLHLYLFSLFIFRNYDESHLRVMLA